MATTTELQAKLRELEFINAREQDPVAFAKRIEEIAGVRRQIEASGAQAEGFPNQEPEGFDTSLALTPASVQKEIDSAQNLMVNGATQAEKDRGANRLFSLTNGAKGYQGSRAGSTAGTGGTTGGATGGVAAGAGGGGVLDPEVIPPSAGGGGGTIPVAGTGIDEREQQRKEAESESLVAYREALALTGSQEVALQAAIAAAQGSREIFNTLVSLRRSPRDALAASNIARGGILGGPAQFIKQILGGRTLDPSAATSGRLGSTNSFLPELLGLPGPGELGQAQASGENISRGLPNFRLPTAFETSSGALNRLGPLESEALTGGFELLGDDPASFRQRAAALSGRFGPAQLVRPGLR